MPRTPKTASTSRSKPAATAAVHEAYPLKTVARLTGLSPDVIRAWERRYAVVSPLRGPRSARLYSGADVAHLRLLGALVGRGRAIGDIAALAPEALRRLAQDEPLAAMPSAEARGGNETIDRLLAALKRFDATEVERLLGESLLGLGISPFIARVGVPLLERIGDLWQQGELSVAEEHVASTTIRSLFGGLIRLRMPRRAPSFLLTSPSGERHELGLSMVALLCLQADLAVAYAGVDLPADEIVGAVRKTRVTVLGLSVVSSVNRKNAVEQIRRIEAALPEEVEIWLGGADAAEVARALGDTRAIVLQSMPAIEGEIGRVASMIRA